MTPMLPDCRSMPIRYSMFFFKSPRLLENVVEVAEACSLSSALWNNTTIITNGRIKMNTLYLFSVFIIDNLHNLTAQEKNIHVLQPARRKRAQLRLPERRLRMGAHAVLFPEGEHRVPHRHRHPQELLPSPY